MPSPPAEKPAAADGQPSSWFPQANFPSRPPPVMMACHYRPEGGCNMSELGADAMRGVPWPSNGLSEIPFRLYTDPEQYRLEQERIFKGPTWNYLCLAAEIPAPGDWVAATLGEVAVIVVRGADGAVNAFVNRCAHRGNLLCLTQKGHGKEIICIYHGWSYD